MARSTVSAVLASTQRVEKYGGVRLTVEALEGLRDQLNEGHVPMQMNHSALKRLDAQVVDARIEERPDREHVLVVDLDFDEDDWAAVEAEWTEAGVLGGFSAAATEIQEKVDGPPERHVVLIADAGAYSDEIRAKAAQAFSGQAKVEVRRLYQFAEPEVAKIAVEFAMAIAADLAAGGLINALMALVGSRQGPSVIEFKLEQPDGGTKTALVETDDPDMVRVAAEGLTQIDSTSQSVLVLDVDGMTWRPSRP